MVVVVLLVVVMVRAQYLEGLQEGEARGHVTEKQWFRLALVRHELLT